MTTKPPSAVDPFPDTSVEKIAYESVNAVETVEPNDRYRLGYHVWRWLASREGTLNDVVRESGVRLRMPSDEAVRHIRESLIAQGISGL